MGYNTSVLILNDALNHIENDPLFGKKLADAIRFVSVDKPQKIDLKHETDKGIFVFCDAVTVIETHHADTNVVIAVGNNQGRVLGYSTKYEKTLIVKDIVKQNRTKK